MCSPVFIPAEEGFGLAAESPVHALMAGAGSDHPNLKAARPSAPQQKTDLWSASICWSSCPLVFVFIPAEEGFGLAAESPVHALMAGAALFTPIWRRRPDYRPHSRRRTSDLRLSLLEFLSTSARLVFIPAEEGFGLAAESPIHALMAGAGSVHPDLKAARPSAPQQKVDLAMGFTDGERELFVWYSYWCTQRLCNNTMLNRLLLLPPGNFNGRADW